MALRGHDKVVESLRAHLPQVSLFVGPYSVGRWTAAEHLRWRYNIDSDDVLRVHQLTVESADTIQEFDLTAPASSSFKLVIIDLYKSSKEAQLLLYSLVKELHYARVIVIAQQSELRSAFEVVAVRYNFKLLSSAAVTEVLIDRLGFGKDKAKDLAARSRRSTGD